MTRTTPLGDSAADQRSYHHGDLRRALIDTTVGLIEEQGVEAVSVREVARRTGVSPAAPFRHFENRTALLTAVAEEAHQRLENAVAESLQEAAEGDGLQKFRAIGAGFLRWAFANPTHFQVISTRAIIDYERAALRGRNDALRGILRGLIAQATSQGLLRKGDVDRHILAGRALVYGLARMHVDGQFVSWGVDDVKAEALKECLAVFDQFIAGMRR